MDDYADLPDVRDGLTRKERIILYCIDKIQNELNGRNVPTPMLYGRVLEYVDISVDEMQLILQKLTGNKSYKKSKKIEKKDVWPLPVN